MIDWLARLDAQVVIVGIALGGVLLAAPLELAAFRRLGRLQLARGTLLMLAGGVVILVGAGAGLVAAHLRTYARLTHEQEAARVTMRRLGERHFAVSVQAGGAAPRQLELRGDEWQIDARVLKWRALGNIVGFDTVYRLERISGRYADIALERSAPRTAHELFGDDAFDIWALVRRYHAWLPLADALYGAAAYVPMADDADYLVTVSASGLVVRPRSDAARKAVTGWK